MEKIVFLRIVFMESDVDIFVNFSGFLKNSFQEQILDSIKQNCFQGLIVDFFKEWFLRTNFEFF